MAAPFLQRLCRSACLVVAACLLPWESGAQSSPIPNLPYWQWQNPLPTGYRHNDLASPADSVACVAADRGTVLKTTNGGRTWQLLNPGVQQDLLAVAFATPQLGWIGYDTPVTQPSQQTNSGPGEVRRTTDGGQSWMRQPLGENRSVRIISIHPISATEVFVFYEVSWRGRNGFVVRETQLRRSTNGGQTWQRVGTQVLPSRFTFPKLQFCSAQVAYLVGTSESSGSFPNGYIWRTTNGGQTWQDITPPGASYDYRGLSFTSARNGWVTAVNFPPAVGGAFRHTTDGGQTWTTDTTRGSYVIAFADSLHGTDGSIVTADGGATWLPAARPLPAGDNLRVVLQPSGYGMASQANRIYQTRSFGTAWQRRDTAFTEANLSAVHAPDPTTAWLLADGLNGRSSDVWRTRRTDGGWYPQRLQARVPAVDWTFGYLAVAAFPDRDTAYLAGAEQFFLPGQQAFFLATTDGGLAWARRPLPPLAALPEALAFRDGRRGVLVADTGTILRTRDGGQTWQQPVSGTRKRFRTVAWADEQTVYAGADSATLCRSTDEGQTWQTFQADSLISRTGGTGSQVIREVYDRQHPIDYLYWTSALVGYTISPRGLARTTDGGRTWIVVPPMNTATGIRSVVFRDSRHGLAFDNSVWRTTDGGLSWTSIAQLASDNSGDTNYESDLINSTGTDDYNVWVTGYTGRVLRYSEKYIQTDTSATQPLSYCTGDTLTVAFDTTGIFSPAERDFRVELSNKMGRFRPNETTLLPLLGSAAASPLRALLPATLPDGTRYRLRVIRADSSVLGGDNQRDLTLWQRPAAVAVSPADSARFCQGDSVQLTAPAGFAAYQWSTGATSTTVWVKQAGSYAVRVANGGGCYGPASAAVQVRVTPLPAQPSFTAQPQPSGIVLLTSSSPSGNQWLLNGSPIPGATAATYAVTLGSQSGTYSLQVTRRGCASPLADPQTITVTATAPEIASTRLTLVPNPAQRRVTLTSAQPLDEVTLTDLSGRRLLRQSLRGATTAELALPPLPTGTYLLTATATNGQPVTRRLLIAP